jgi:dTDP-glucose pyrophosphorylase/CBS domain-containing protein
MSARPDLLVTPSTLMRDVIAQIDRNESGIALVVDDGNRLIGTVTDGDIRRALLAGLQLDASTARDLLESKSPAAPRSPTTALIGSAPAELLELMNRHQLRQIPLVDEDGKVMGLELLSNLVQDYELPIRAVVMAGGYGTRLRPLTEHHPKPMLPVGNRPLLELIVDRLQQAGIRNVYLATHYKAEMIEQHFGDGHRFGIDITYITEDEPLGTAGALSRVQASDEPLLVMNGDVLSDVNLEAMLDFHRAHAAALTVAVRPYEFQVPYGVLRTEGVEVKAVDEKPVLRHLVNAGIYLVSGRVCSLVPAGEPFDMTDLIERAIAEGLRVISFPLREHWLDIGRAEDYARAVSEFAQSSDE